MAKPVKLIALAALLGIAVAVFVSTRSEKPVFRPIEELKARITTSLDVPDPTDIQSTGDWYYLDHVSSGLVFYDADKKKFAPLFAESWSTAPDGTHRFQLKKDIRFHDGTPITSKDIIWSIKRHLIKKTATHFPLWDYIVGCESLKNLNDECDGLKATSDSEIEIRLKVQNETFFLQLASPETGIWAATDTNPVTLKITPTKFSGPYFLSGRSESSAILKRNENSPLSAIFSESPRSIRLFAIPAAKLNQALTDRTIDLAIRPYSPLGEPDWRGSEVEVYSTTASNIFYLFGLGVGDRPAIGRDFIEALWSLNADSKISPAETFLPFSSQFGLSRAEFIESLPATSARKIRIFCPEAYFAPAFLEQLKTAGAKVGTEIELSFAPGIEWLKTFNDPEANKKYDYMLSLYSASERYPAVQLRYMTKKLVHAPIDLKPAESPDLNIDRVKILRDYQKWLLNSRQAIPLFFGNTLFLHQREFDLGNQSQSDAEIELWRVRKKIP